MNFAGILILSLLLYCHGSFAATVDGLVLVDGKQHFLLERTTSRTFEIQPINDSVRRSLKELQTLDGLQGEVVSTEDKKIVLGSIDFVSLFRLVGEWTGAKCKAKFLNYSQLYLDIPDMHGDFEYALSPTGKNGWKIFISNQETVTLGSLFLKGDTLVIEFFESNGKGSPLRIELVKVTSRSE